MFEFDCATEFARTKVEVYPLPGINDPAWDLGYEIVELLMEYLNAAD